MLSTLLLLSSVAVATEWPEAASWVPLTVEGLTLTDPSGDHTGASPVDIVGEEVSPAGYWYADGEALFLRLRIDSDPWTSSAHDYLQGGSWAVVFDLDGDATQVEFAAILTGPVPSVFLYEPQDDSEGLAAPFVVADILTPDLDDLYRIEESSSLIGGQADWFLDYALPRTDLEAFVGLAADSVFQLAFATGQYSGGTWLDADLAGTDGTFDLAGGLSGELTIDADEDGLTDPEETAAGTDPADGDTDDDGLSDTDEVLVFGSDPNACDGDSDSLPDSLEVGATSPYDDGEDDVCFVADGDAGATTTDPLAADTDGGTVADGDEDWDGDGAIDTWEIDPNDPSDDLDTDGDGIWDALELRCDLDGGEVDDEDSDADGFSDAEEWLVDTDGDGLADFCDTDSDDDGTPDAEEGDGDTDCDGIPDVLDSDDQDGPCGDADGDGLSNEDEPPCGTDPQDADSDDDGLLDGAEDCHGDDDCDGLADPLDGDPDDSTCDEPGDTGSEVDGVAGAFSGGQFTGGACSSAPGLPGLAPALLSLLALVRRRGAWLALLARPAALAANEGAAEPLDAQRFDPAAGGDTFFGLADPEIGEPMRPGAALVFNYADDPFIYRYDDPDREELEVLGRVATTDLVAWFTVPRVRLSLDLPLHVYSQGYQQQGFKLIGDLGAAATAEAWSGRLGPGLAVAGVTGRLGLPTGQQEAWLGEATVTAGLTADLRYSVGPVRLAASAGFHSGTGERIGDVVWGHRLPYALGAAWSATDAVHVSAELDGDLILGSTTPGSRPAELLAGAHVRILEDFTARVGLGMGITRGIGAPDWRAVAGLTWHPGEVQAVVSFADADGDGIPDHLDLCVDQAEDLNGVDDTDGCPDGTLTPTRVRILDPAGHLVTQAVVDLNSGPWAGSFTLASGELTRSLPPGTYGGVVEAEGYQTLIFTLEVPDDQAHEQALRLAPVVVPVQLTVSVRTEDGLPLTQAWVRAIGQDQELSQDGAEDGLTRLSLPPGAWNVIISAPGHRTAERALTLQEGQTATMDIVLEPGRVALEGDRIRIFDKVYFELDSAEIKRESFSLLDEVAQLLLDHPELALVTVHGHTDDQGAEDYNLDLSLRRAQAVTLYLVQVGVPEGRLSASGFGETQPLVQETTDSARAANRRVEFHVSERRPAE